MPSDLAKAPRARPAWTSSHGFYSRLGPWLTFCSQLSGLVLGALGTLPRSAGSAIFAAGAGIVPRRPAGAATRRNTAGIAGCWLGELGGAHMAGHTVVRRLWIAAVLCCLRCGAVVRRLRRGLMTAGGKSQQK